MNDYSALYKSPEGYAAMTRFYDTSLEKLPVPVESVYVDTRWGQTHMLAAGPADAPPLFLLQGMAGSAILWHYQFEDFSRQHRVYALDLVGGPGRSAPNPPSLFDDSYAEWLRDVLDGLGYEKADFAGVSIGGWIIMRLGLVYPERVRKAVLLSPLRLARAKMNIRRWVGNAVKPETEDESLEDRLTARDFSPSEGKQSFNRQLARAMALATKHYKLGVAMGIPTEANRLRKFQVGLRVLWKFATPMPKRDLEALHVPSLIVMGEHEILYNPALAIRRASQMPSAMVDVIPDAGHAAIYDRPDYVNPRILAFLDSPAG
jgi:pimeloyl-ACP methyl ester carboxylesterase